MTWWFVTWLVWLSAPSSLDAELGQQTNAAALASAIRYLGRTRGFPVSERRSHRLARAFIEYGGRWHVNPYLLAAVACRESGFRLAPKAVRIRKCETEIVAGRAVRRCHLEPGGEQGVMQILPSSAAQAYYACTGRRHWRHNRDLARLETNVCLGAWLLAERRASILARLRAGRPFVVVGSMAKWSRRHRPCSRAQRRFCRAHPWVCERFWWVASYNWGSHQLVCGPTSRGYDFQGYPIRVLSLYLEAAEYVAGPGRGCTRLRTADPGQAMSRQPRVQAGACRPRRSDPTGSLGPEAARPVETVGPDPAGPSGAARAFGCDPTAWAPALEDLEYAMRFPGSRYWSRLLPPPVSVGLAGRDPFVPWVLGP